MTQRAAPATARVELARALLAERRADEAERLLQSALAERPGDPDLLGALAGVHAALGRPGERLASVEAAWARRPDDLDLGLDRAEALAALGRRGEADAVLAGLVERHPASHRPRAARARLAERRQRPELAEVFWRRVLALRPEDLPARQGVGRALRAAGRFAEAEAYGRSLLALFPGESGPLEELARIAHDAGDPLLAEARWRQALARGRRPVEATLGLAQALAGQHRFEDARALLEGLERASPERGEVTAALARILAAEGDLDAAEQALLRLIAREPAGLEHRLALGRVLEQRWDYGAAATLYREADARWPQAAAVALAMGGLAALQGDHPAARDAYRAVLQRDAEHVEARLGLAEAAIELDEPEEAGRWLAEALALAPLSLRVHQARARLAEAAGRIEEARLLLLEARSALPEREQPRLWLIAFALRGGEADSALDQAEAALVAHPRSLNVQLAAVDAALAAGCTGRALDLLEPLAEALPRHREVEKRLARLETLAGDAARARRRWWRIARFDPRIHGPVDHLERLDRHPLPPAEGEVRVFLVVRNERTRLPWLFDYYRGLGADRFVVLDNASDDGTTAWLREQGPDVHTFWTDGSYGRSASGIRWLHHLLDRHGTGAWVLNVDGDEVLVYPHVETLGLKALTRHLEAQGAEAMLAPMLDMYAAAPMDELVYEPGASLIEAFPYFDAEGYVRRESNVFPFLDLHGGCRTRVFYAAPTLGPVLQKVPLLRWSPGMRYLSGRHTSLPCRLAAETGALLHFKYTPEFSAYVRTEVARGEHYRGGKEYRVYLKRLESGASLSFLHEGSARYAGSRQLVDLGLIRTTPELDAHAQRERPAG